MNKKVSYYYNFGIDPKLTVEKVKETIPYLYTQNFKDIRVEVTFENKTNWNINVCNLGKKPNECLETNFLMDLKKPPKRGYWDLDQDFGLVQDLDTIDISKNKRKLHRYDN